MLLQASAYLNCTTVTWMLLQASAYLYYTTVTWMFLQVQRVLIKSAQLLKGGHLRRRPKRHLHSRRCRRISVVRLASTSSSSSSISLSVSFNHKSTFTCSTRTNIRDAVFVALDYNGKQLTMIRPWWWWSSGRILLWRSKFESRWRPKSCSRTNFKLGWFQVKYF